MNQSCMYFGIETGDGWYNLIDELCEKFITIEKLTGIQVVFRQIKEKNAELAIHHEEHCPKPLMGEEDARCWFDIISELVDYTEYKSNYVCEECGERRNKTHARGSWLYALCNICYKAFVKERFGEDLITEEEDSDGEKRQVFGSKDGADSEVQSKEDETQEGSS